MVRFSSKNTIEFMNRLPIIQGQKIFERLDFKVSNVLNLWIDWLSSKAKKVLKQRLDFQ